MKLSLVVVTRKVLFMVFLQRVNGVLSQKNPTNTLRKVFKNTQYMTFEIPPLKLAKILENGLSILALKFCLVKKLASWVGLLQSCKLAIGPVVSIMCRALYDTIKLAPFWSSNIKLSLSSILKIEWWRCNLSPSKLGFF